MNWESEIGNLWQHGAHHTWNLTQEVISNQLLYLFVFCNNLAPSRVTEWGLARISLGSKEEVNKKEQELI